MPLRKREEIQEMLRRRRLSPALLTLAALALPLQAQIWPEAWGEHTRAKAEPVPIESPTLWAEYEGQAAERASFRSPIGPFAATAWRLRDSTSALSWYYHVRPDNCTPIRGSISSCNTSGTAFLTLKNYVLRVDGWRPLPREIASLETLLPAVRSGGGLPNLPAMLPEQDRIRNSERYIVGLESLSLFEPRIPPSIAGFEDGAEAIFARYRTPSGELPVTVFTFPTPQIARKRLEMFKTQTGFTAVRSGTLVSVVPVPFDSDAALAVLNKIEWNVNVTRNEATKPPPMPDVAGMLIAIFQLTGLLLVICVGGGLLYAGLVYLGRRRARETQGTEATITLLNLD